MSKDDLNNNNNNNNNKRPRNPNDSIIIITNKKRPNIDDWNEINQINEIERLIEQQLLEERLEAEKLQEEILKKKEQEKELIIIDKKINNLNDLIELGESYDSNKRYNIDIKMLNNMVPHLKNLNKLIGMQKVKNDIIEHIIFYLQKLDDKNIDMLHTVIEGPPGVGKTELGKILGKIYLSMGILKNDTFKKVSRPDMVAKYLGQTAIKTEELIDSCSGGVMFIDEVYSLGNKEGRDSFSKEAIDTLNMKLSEMKNEFICIVAGYPREIEECFFSYNLGLSSRFPIKFSIDPYTPRELLKIFQLIVKENNWELDESIRVSFFKKNYDNFKFYGRDMELLFTKCKRAHSRRIFTDSSAIKKKITYADINIAIKSFILNK
jgi:SpoVK/Ycf46/Vps4 family AAA+-type ATPase